MMGFQTFLVALFLIGIGVEANTFESCKETINFEEGIEAIFSLESEDHINLFCVNMTNFLRCINDQLKGNGSDMDVLADLYSGTVIGKEFTILLKMQKLFEDSCTGETELRAGTEVRKYPYERCYKMVNSDEITESSFSYRSCEEILNLYTVNVTNYLTCLKAAQKKVNGIYLKKMSELLRETDIGTALSIAIELQGDTCKQGTEAEEEGEMEKKHTFQHCSETSKLEESIASVTEKDTKELLNLLCVDMLVFWKCVDNSFLEKIGIDLKELTDFHRDTHVGNYLNSWFNLIELLTEDICTEGNELRDAFLMSVNCYSHVPVNIYDECRQRSKDADLTYKEFQEEAPTITDEYCIEFAYLVGCIGVVTKEQCDEQGFETYKKIIKKIGYGFCSPELLNFFKSIFLDSLDITEDEKSLYRVVLNLKR